jgi:predicted nucleotide-binding protein (sugar kinase/HSP70/actin superfamily)
MRTYPNLVDYEANWAFRSLYKVEPMPEQGERISDTKVKRGLFGGVKHQQYSRGFERSDSAQFEARKKLRIGIPKVLNIWSTAPFWRAYFEALGIPSRQIVFSDDTGEEMWQAGGKYGSVDPCFPAKVAQAHIHNLFFEHHDKKPLDYIFFPSLTHVPTFVEGVMDTACCPIVAGTPNVIRAAFTKEQDLFAKRGIEYIDPAVSMMEPLLLKSRLYDVFGDKLFITEDENNFAIDQAYQALAHFDQHMEQKGRAILDAVEEDGRVALLMIGRPYHNDPGMNHSVLEEYQSMGYPILSMRSIPKDKDYLTRYFAEDLAKKHVDSPLEIHDIWPENFSVNSVQKVWSAKFASRHPNVAVLDLSSFKCGHDAPTYGLVDRIMESSGSPYSALHDIDANKPSGSIKIRVKTYGYTLKLAEEKLEDAKVREMQLEASMLEKRLHLLEQAPAHIKQDESYLIELDKWRAKKAQLYTVNQDEAVKTPIAQPMEVNGNMIPIVEVD